MSVRPAAVAGTWYPGTRGALDARSGRLSSPPSPDAPPLDVRAIIAPHAGIMFSGPVAAYAYKAAAAARPYDVVALVGPSHFVAFEGVARVSGRRIRLAARSCARSTATAWQPLAASPIVQQAQGPHDREHSLEMQLPFLRRLLPDVPIVPLLMGFQRRETILDARRGAGDGVHGSPGAARREHRSVALFRRARRRRRYDGRVSERVAAFDPEGCSSSSSSIRSTSAGATWRAAAGRRSR